MGYLPFEKNVARSGRVIVHAQYQFAGIGMLASWENKNGQKAIAEFSTTASSRRINSWSNSCSVTQYFILVTMHS